MATLYVENVPDDLYEAIRQQAQERRTSIAREVIDALKARIPTQAELDRRRAVFEEILKFQGREPLTPGPHPSTEEIVREDRQR